MDASFFSIVGAAGELFSIRTHLFSSIDDHVILDDFIISMQVCLQGYRFAYEPDAFATETASDSLIEESKKENQNCGRCLSIGSYPQKPV